MSLYGLMRKMPTGIIISRNILGAMMRGVECEDAGKGGESIPSVPHQTKESAALWESVIPIDPLAPFIYDGCTNIHFPIHTSVKFAHQVGLPGIIHQGTATLAVAVHNILNQRGGRRSAPFGNCLLQVFRNGASGLCNSGPPHR